MAAQDVSVQLYVAQSLPDRMAEKATLQNGIRVDPWKGQYVQPIFMGDENQADEGSYFVATNPTPGTAIAYGSAGTQASFSDTVPFFLYKNNAGAGTGTRMYLKNLKLIQIGGTAPATTTSVQVAVKTDNVPRFPTSAASTYTAATPVNANNNSTRGAVGQLWVPNGAVATIPASGGSARLVDRVQLKGGPTLVLDQYELLFCAPDNAQGGGYLTTVSKYSERVSPVILGPQEYAVVHLWFPGGATNPFTFEFSTSWRER
jgi:hypothetical protein